MTLSGSSKFLRFRGEFKISISVEIREIDDPGAEIVEFSILNRNLNHGFSTRYSNFLSSAAMIDPKLSNS